MFSRVFKVTMMSFLLPLLISACSDHAPITNHEELPLRVVSWNIRGCQAGLEKIIDELRRHDADIICLQEAWVDTEREQGLDQPASIAHALGMRHFSAGSVLPNGKEQRMAILSRSDITDTEGLDANTGRIYGVAGVIRLGTRPIRIISIHLTSSYQFSIQHALKTSRARDAEAAHVNSLLKDSERKTILAGDFNCLPGMPEHDLIVRDLIASETTHLTFPSEKPAVALDHIYHTKGLRTQSLSVERSLASDHLPVIATICIEGHPGK